MPKKPLDPETVQRLVALRRDGKSYREIGRELKIDHTVVMDYAKKYLTAEEAASSPGEAPPKSPLVGQAVDRREIDGSVEMFSRERPPSLEQLMSACGLDPKRWVAQYFRPNAWQGFCKMRVGEGEKVEKVQLYQSRAVFKRVMTQELEEGILEFVRSNVTALPAPKARGMRTCDLPRQSFMVCWGLWDAHLGMYAWQSETGNDFDISIARARILNSIDDMVAELKPYGVERVVMPIGNDFLHFDSVRNKTAFGDHFLDTDTRFAKVYCTGLECLSYMVEKALTLTDRLDLLYVPGNHDTTASFTLCVALQQRFRNDPRVTVDLGANPRKYVTHGGTLLGFDHGLAKRQLAQIFATEAHKEWSASTYREIQVGHTHQRAEDHGPTVVPTNGVVIRTNPSLCGNDLWHHRQGFIGEPVKSVEAYRYDTTGFRGSHVVWARDEKRS